jgi:hypothetical protein
MQPTTIAAIIGGVAAIIAAVIGLFKFGGSTRTSKIARTSKSNVAIGDNITQTYQDSTYNYISLSKEESGDIHRRVPSNPSLIEIAHALRVAKPYDKIQFQRIMWAC